MHELQVSAEVVSRLQDRLRIRHGMLHAAVHSVCTRDDAELLLLILENDPQIVIALAMTFGPTGGLQLHAFLNKHRHKVMAALSYDN